MLSAQTAPYFYGLHVQQAALLAGAELECRSNECLEQRVSTVRTALELRVELCAKAAISSPLLETSIAGAHGVIINITSSPDIGLEDVETAAGLITQSAHPDANIIWGTAFDENLSDEMRVTVVATGFDNKSASDLRSSISNAMGGAQSTPSAVFSSETASPAASAAGGAAPAPTAEKPVEEDNSDNGYYDQLMAMLNKRR